MKHYRKSDTELASFPFLECKAEDGPDGPVFEGLLSTHDLDLGGDIVEPGAFKRTLRHWRQGKGRIIPLLDQHDRFSSVNAVLGKLLEAEEQTKGLWTRWGMVPDDERAAAAHKRLGGGFVDGMSIGYRPVKTITPTPQEQQSGVRRRLKEVHLREGSVVIFPMNENTRVDQATVKTLMDELGVTITVDAGNVVGLSRLLELSAKAELSDDETEEKLELIQQFGASKPAEGDGLAPDDPARIAQAERLRGLKTRGLALGR